MPDNNSPTAAASPEQETLWYKDAIIYQLHIRAFHDSNEDGIGDFQGLIQKLDYLSNLGINAIWLLPFYPSPLKDDGYDIADYANIHPSYGTIDDFQQFLAEAHRRNIRVITELVINHTSDQHDWFQKSRRAPVGSYWRDFYVWSDDPKKYKGTRIIFKDFETSNWAWDPIAKSYYWHRFYSHQPDLNFDNPEVQKAVFKAFDFWMEMGVDGMRLDAIPYLFEREGTSSENLPETHAFLKKLRAYIDSKFPGKMLLAEANQWPEDAVKYFGDGDECHMNFHFPLMPRLFMALKMEDRYSIIDILKQTPEIPENCQWATFLRNHDELTLEMVTDEERDYMYKVYASDPRARINLGVRRRLAPLVGNDRRQIELLNSLLFSLHGSPVIYYGDEIGMGDNIYLGDRDGVRTPFQWSSDRNAGFSRANTQKLYMPVISTPEYHAESINVENLKSNPTSLLWWMTKLIALRSAYPELSRGKLEFIDSTNPKVLSYVRQLGDTAIVCVVNLSRNPQFVNLDLSRFKGATPLELFGQTDFPIVTEAPYVLTLAPYFFYWLQMPVVNTAQVTERNLKESAVNVGANPLQALHERKTWGSFAKNLRHYLEGARWFGGKGRRIGSLELMELIPIVPLESDSAEAPAAPSAVGGPGGPVKASGVADTSYLSIVKVNYAEGLSDHYLLGLGHAYGERAQRMLAERPKMVIAETISGVVAKSTAEPSVAAAHLGVYYDALLEGPFCRSLLETVIQNQRIVGEHGKLITEFHGDSSVRAPEPTPMTGEQSNSSMLFGKQYYMKYYRRLEEGENPEVEIGRFLTRQNFKDTAPFVGALSYKAGSNLASVAIVQQVVENESDGWSLMIGQISQVEERILSEGLADKCPELPPLNFTNSRGLKPPEDYQLIAGYTLRLAHQLGVRTAEMHIAMGSNDHDPGFIPESYTPFHQRSVFQSFRNLVVKTMSQLRESLPRLEGRNRELAQTVLDSEAEIYKKFSYMKDVNIDAARIRVHGDYHLGQVLFTGQDFYIIDFEGEPARSLGERKLKRSPLKDVAGMLRSFDYVAEFHMKKFVLREQDRARIENCLHVWASWMKTEFMNAYMDKMEDQSLLPKEADQVEALLQMFVLEKALYEIGYELRNRPDWVNIPIHGILQLLGKDMK